jgi:hypothetical protein
MGALAEIDRAAAYIQQRTHVLFVLANQEVEPLRRRPQSGGQCKHGRRTAAHQREAPGGVSRGYAGSTWLASSTIGRTGPHIGQSVSAGSSSVSTRHGATPSLPKRITSPCFRTARSPLRSSVPDTDVPLLLWS